MIVAFLFLSWTGFSSVQVWVAWRIFCRVTLWLSNSLSQPSSTWSSSSITGRWARLALIGSIGELEVPAEPRLDLFVLTRVPIVPEDDISDEPLVDLLAMRSSVPTELPIPELLPLFYFCIGGGLEGTSWKEAWMGSLS